MLSRSELFKQIQTVCSVEITKEWISSVYTRNGDTQMNEKKVVNKIADILNSMKLNYIKAGSQQPKDFRNVGDIGLDIEIKKRIILKYILMIHALLKIYTIS